MTREAETIGWIFRDWGEPKQATRRTDTRFYYDEAGRERYGDAHTFTGPFPTKEAAQKARERITSSLALLREEQAGSHERHRARVAKIIAKFQGSANDA